MIVDTHVHVYPDELRKDQENISKREPHFDLLTHNKVHKWGTAEELIAQMERDGVDQSWIFGFAFKDIGLCRLCNDYVIEAVKRWPDRFKGLAVVPPRDPGMEAEVARCHDAGLVGVGELFPQGQDLALGERCQTKSFVGVCGERNMILVIHTAEPVGHEYDGKGDVGPKEAAQFCMNHPEAKVVFAHWGGGLWLYEAMPEMRRILANARYDTAAWPWLYGGSFLAAAAAVGVGHKILYGSDWPILTYPRYEKRLAEAGIPESVISAVLSENALAFMAP
ncbi:MAG: metal-dependent hydrolase [Dethiosulfovibrio peptidovorans]|nr:MAG: metal-dependent hydrolase [Dethiosulfovibrio peptidovorans]